MARYEEQEIRCPYCNHLNGTRKVRVDILRNGEGGQRACRNGECNKAFDFTLVNSKIVTSKKKH